MPNLILKFSEGILFSLLFVSALAAALFYTGIDMSLFTACFILITLSFALVIRQRFYSAITISISGIFISAILLLLWYAISIFTSPITYLSLHSFFNLGSIFIIFIIFTLYDNKDDVWNMLWPLILLVIFVWAIWGLVQYYYLHVPTNASFLNRNTLAALINLLLIPASGYFLLEEKQRPWEVINNKILGLILFILFLTTFIITSRGGSLSLIFGFIILFYLLKNHINKSKYFSLFIIIFVAFLFSHLSQYFSSGLPAGFTERMVSLTESKTAGHPRFIIWESVLPLFNDMPWYGVGLGSFWLFWAPYRPATDNSAGFFAHNDYMQMTIEAGYPGIILLVLLFVFMLLSLMRALKSNQLTLLHRVEIISLFAALATYAAHSMFTYNFYILPLLIIAGLYLARFNQLTSVHSKVVKILPAFKTYFHPVTFTISLGGFVIILCGYFLAASLSTYYNKQASQFMLQYKYEDADAYYTKAQRLAPLVDNPFFSHANMLMNAASRLKNGVDDAEAEALLLLAHEKLNHAEKLNPLRHQIFHIRGMMFIKTQPEKAKKQFEKALSLAPRYLHSRIQLATLLHKEKDLSGAINVLHKGLFYKYRASREVVNYLSLYAQFAKEAGDEKFSLHLEREIKRIFTGK